MRINAAAVNGEGIRTVAGISALQRECKQNVSPPDTNARDSPEVANMIKLMKTAQQDDTAATVVATARRDNVLTTAATVERQHDGTK